MFFPPFLSFFWSLRRRRRSGTLTRGRGRDTGAGNQSEAGGDRWPGRREPVGGSRTGLRCVQTRGRGLRSGRGYLRYQSPGDRVFEAPRPETKHGTSQDPGPLVTGRVTREVAVETFLSEGWSHITSQVASLPRNSVAIGTHPFSPPGTPTPHCQVVPLPSTLPVLNFKRS